LMLSVSTQYLFLILAIGPILGLVATFKINPAQDVKRTKMARRT